MNHQDILNHIDHTVLSTTATEEDILKICRETEQFHTASVCISPCYVSFAKSHFPNLNICTVVGFPHGTHTKAVKEFETITALQNGASEIDMVINMTQMKNGAYDAIQQEISSLLKICGNHVLKVIVETCYLTQGEKIKICQILNQCWQEGSQLFIKTSTGFGTAGAVLDDILLFRNYLRPEIKIKAAGGIRTVEDMTAFLNAGCERIGSSAAKILFE